VTAVGIASLKIVFSTTIFSVEQSTEKNTDWLMGSDEMGDSPAESLREQSTMNQAS